MTTIVTLLVIQFNILVGSPNDTKSDVNSQQIQTATTCGGTGTFEDR